MRLKIFDNSLSNILFTITITILLKLYFAAVQFLQFFVVLGSDQTCPPYQTTLGIFSLYKQDWSVGMQIMRREQKQS